MLKTIVWATDGSEAADRALPYVKTLAAGGDAAVPADAHAAELETERETDHDRPVSGQRRLP